MEAVAALVAVNGNEERRTGNLSEEFYHVLLGAGLSDPAHHFNKFGVLYSVYLHLCHLKNISWLVLSTAAASPS